MSYITIPKTQQLYFPENIDQCNICDTVFLDKDNLSFQIQGVIKPNSNDILTPTFASDTNWGKGNFTIANGHAIFYDPTASPGYYGYLTQGGISFVQDRYYVIQLTYTQVSNTAFTGIISLTSGSGVQVFTERVTFLPNTAGETVEVFYLHTWATGDMTIKIEVESASDISGFFVESVYQYVVNFVEVYGVKDGVETLLIDQLDVPTSVANGAQLCGYNILYNPTSAFATAYPSNDFKTDCYQIKIYDDGDNVTDVQKSYLSQLFKVVDTEIIDSCLLNGHLKLIWWGDCPTYGLCSSFLSGGLPQKNMMWVRGGVYKAPLDRREQIAFFSPTGVGSLIYSFTTVKRQLKIAPYSEYLHEVLERVFYFDNVYVGQGLNTAMKIVSDDASLYTIINHENGYYSGGIEVLESGKELIKSSCCGDSGNEDS